MDYHKEFVILYGACGAAIEALDNKKYSQCREILEQAILAAEEEETNDTDGQRSEE